VTDTEDAEDQASFGREMGELASYVGLLDDTIARRDAPLTRFVSDTVRAELRRQGIAASRIKEQKAAKTGGKIEPGDIAVFSRQLATMLAAGIPLVQSFEIVGAGHEKPGMQKLILDIKGDVEAGTSLHESLAKHPLYFDDLFVNLVEAGEQAGALETLLDKIATYKEKTEALKKKVKKALFYPAAVLAVALFFITLTLTLVQTRVLERRVHYGR
jgi:type IV pilus assembly protein PilC